MLFTDLFGGIQSTARLMPRPAETPLSNAINQIQDKSAEGKNNEHASEQHQCSQHFLNKINLQCDKSGDGNPQPFSSFLVSDGLKERLAECLTDFHFAGPLPVTLDLMQFTAQLIQPQFKT